jgi:osmotically-inducible protein OsmY
MTRNLLLAAALALSAIALQGCVAGAVVGAGTVALIADDRRTTGIYIEDENIEWKAVAKVYDQFKGSHINATSFNRKLLLTGEVSTEDTKKAAEAAMRSIPSVVSIANELAIGANSSITTRGNDSLVTSSVKARLVGNGKVSPTHVKVVTESGTVFLMGLVTQAEGDAAVEVARSTAGVSRVVKVFEYLPPK